MNKLSDPQTWLDRHGDFLYSYALFRVRESSVAEDMVQETLLAAVQAQTRYAGNASERTWLTGILKHKITDYLRRGLREQTLGEDFQATADRVDEDAFDAAGRWRTELGQWMNPDRALEQGQFWEVFSECVSHLPTRQAEAFIQREIDGRGNDEICQDLGITTTNNLWVMLSRARMRLRQCLEAHWFHPQQRE